MGSVSKKGDSWFTGTKPAASFSQQVTATAADDLLHVRDPSLDARPDHGPAGQLAHVRPVLISASPGAPSFPRRPGRWRARPAAAAEGRRQRSRCRSASDTPQALAAVPFRARLPIPRELTRLPHPDPDPRGRSRRSCPAARPSSGPTAAPSRARPSAAAPASGPRSPSTTSCRPRPASSSVHLHGGHNRTQFDGQPGGLTKSQPVSLYCHIPRGLSPRQSGNDLLLAPGAQQNLRLRPDARTGARNGPRSSGTTTTASTAPLRTAGAAWRGCGSSTTSSRTRCRCPRATATSR